MRMKDRFRLYRRAGVFYAKDNTASKQESLRTKDPKEAERLLNAKNEAYRQPAMNLQMARLYIQHSDPEIAKRTWQDVMDQMLKTKQGSTLERWQTAIADKSLDSIRNGALFGTTAGR